MEEKIMAPDIRKIKTDWKTLAGVGLLVVVTGFMLAGCNMPAGIGVITPTASQIPPTPLDLEAVTSTPEAVEDPGPGLLAEGIDVFLAYSNCFDLDTGRASAGPDQGCDFSAAPGPGSEGLTIEFRPAAPAQFAFGGVYTQEPTVDQCRDSEFYSFGTEIVNPLEYYVCYQTNEGLYGVMYFSDLDGVNGISFDWKTYDLAGVVPTMEPTPTSTATPMLDTGIFRQDEGSFLSFDNCFDFDDGALFADDPACEIAIEAGEQEGSVLVIPQGLSRFAAGAAFLEAPALEQCAGSTNFSSDEAQVQPTGYHYCYQTNDGRFGYLYVETVDDGNGITFDWVTFAASSPIPTPTPGVTPTAEATLALDTTDDDPVPTLGEADFDDEFTDAANWIPYSNEHAAFEIESGKLRMTAVNADFYESFLMSWATMDDAYIELVATTGTCSGPDRYGIVLRADDSAGNWPGYVFGVTCDGQYSLRTFDGRRFDAVLGWSPSTVIKSGSNQTNRIGIRAEGNAFRFYINGDLIGSISDTTYGEGKIGVFVGAGHTPNFTVQVDRMRMWELP